MDVDASEAHLYVGKMGELDGWIVADLTLIRNEFGVFWGCRSIEELGMDVESVLRLLSNGEGHYLEFVSSSMETKSLTHKVFRGQLFRDVKLNKPMSYSS
jgi:hypothetical protein